MQFSLLLSRIAALLCLVALFATVWLYSYPPLHGCSFPQPSSSRHAPFRLLALGDPQIEGDSSFPKSGPFFPSLEFLAHDIRNAGSPRRTWYLLKTAVYGANQDLWKGVKSWVQAHRKRLDLWGNDWYLAHIVRITRWWTRPTHIAVVGDLLGSQWVSDDEFEKRANRYWARVFKGMERVGDEIMWADGRDGKWESTVEVLGADKSWENRLINIAGNHDVGYSGDLDEHRISRFEKAFGRVNWDIWFSLPQSNGTQDTRGVTAPFEETLSESAPEIQTALLQETQAALVEDEHHHKLNQDATGRQPADPPSLRLVVLNSMNLDTPAFSETLQHETYDFLNHIIATSRPVTSKSHTTILLTHIPLHKRAGVCYDSPLFSFFDSGSGVEEQNMLSEHSSSTILEGLFGLSGNEHAEGKGRGRNGIILNGHDHEGCDVLHFIPQNEHLLPTCFHPALAAGNVSTVPRWKEWNAIRLPSSPSTPKDPLHTINDDLTRSPCEMNAFSPNIREVTLRSMMGEFGGYAGFLSAWFDDSKGQWNMEFKTCGVGVQHWWWAVHVLDLLAIGILATCGVVRVASKLGRVKDKGKQKKA